VIKKGTGEVNYHFFFSYWKKLTKMISYVIMYTY